MYVQYVSQEQLLHIQSIAMWPLTCSSCLPTAIIYQQRRARYSHLDVFILGDWFLQDYTLLHAVMYAARGDTNMTPTRIYIYISKAHKSSLDKPTGLPEIDYIRFVPALVTLYTNWHYKLYKDHILRLIFPSPIHTSIQSNVANCSNIDGAPQSVTLYLY